VGFGTALRASGLDAPVSSVSCFARALAAVGVGHPEHVYWAGHASFVRRPEDSGVYSAAFASYFGHGAAAEVDRLPAVALTLLVDDGDATGEDEDAGERDSPVHLVRYSRSELLRQKDFAACSEDEIAQVHRLMASMRHRSPRRTTRRRVPARRSGGSPDLRRTMRRAMRHGGEPVRLARLGRGERDRAVVLLVDVSGSMEPYARAFLHFAHASVAARRRVEAFTIGTRLTRITRELSWHDPDAAISRAAESVADISGGTRLGDSLESFNDRFGVAGMARGAVVVILSDGWDRGDPEKIAVEMARLRRVAYRVIWVNPLKATPGYEPLARGMAAALGYVDVFVEGHSLGSLERLVELMGAQGSRREEAGRWS